MRQRPDGITATRTIADVLSPNPLTATTLALTAGAVMSSRTHTHQSRRSGARPSSLPYPHYQSQRLQTAMRRTAAAAAAAGPPTSARSCGPRASSRGACCPPHGGRPRASAGPRAAREITTTTTGAVQARTARRRRTGMKTTIPNYAGLSTTVTTAADLRCRGGGRGAAAGARRAPTHNSDRA